MNRIFAYILHKNGVVDDSAFELVAATKKIDASASATAVVCGSADELAQVCESLRTWFHEIWKISHDEFAHQNAEAVRQALHRVIPTGSVFVLAHEHFGIDLAPGLSIKLNAPYVPDVLDISTEGDHLTLVRQEFGGAVSAHVSCSLQSGAIISVRPGTFKLGNVGGFSGTIVDKSAEIGNISVRRRYIETVAAATGEVDITKQALLVSVGRGIQGAENISIAEDLAHVLGGAVSCSRPVADAKWLDKSRQVGSSGATVKPKIYLACGISGSFQHLMGIRGNPLLVAVNKNPKAPIFQAADIGIVDDMLEFLPVLTAKLREVSVGDSKKATQVA